MQNHSDILDKLRKSLKEKGADAYFCFVSDPHLSEYIAPRYETVRFLTGFTGTDARLLVSQEKAWLWADSRYWEQARIELKNEPSIELMTWGAPETPEPLEMIAKLNTGSPLHLALDPSIFPYETYREIEDSVCKVICVGEDFIDRLWPDRPLQEFRNIWPIKAGQDVSEKLVKMESELDRVAKERSVPSENLLLLSCKMDDCAWLTNLRGSDIEYNPVFYSAVLLGKKVKTIFLNVSSLSRELTEQIMASGLSIAPYQDFWPCVRKLASQGWYFAADTFENNALLGCVPADHLFSVRWPIASLKSIKTPSEIEGMRLALKLDAEAQIATVAEIRRRLSLGETLTESDCALILHKEHTKQKEFITESFATSAATGENAALPHYEPVPGRDSVLVPPCLLLIDSGAHYTCGTTDTTRVYLLGNKEDLPETTLSDIKKDYTAVYNGLMALTNTSFKPGTCGADIDWMAHTPIKALGIDYGHGTGHGVGYILNVHETPPSISGKKRPSSLTPLQPGMIHSIEPGIYREHVRGIRLENMVVVVQKDSETLGFETLTSLPIDKDLLE